MEGYEFALFLHVCGALVLFAAIGLEMVGGSQLFGAREVAAIRLWSGALAVNGRLFPIAVVGLLASGLFMTFDAWEITTPWVLTSLIAFVVMSGLGSTVQGRRMPAIHAAAAALPDGPMPEQLRAQVVDPVMWTAIGGSAGSGLGIVFLMTTKPGWVGSILVIVVAALVGAGAGRAAASRAGANASPQVA
jgi:uncharacterized membrane protein